jgi:hypothetical protein
MLLQQLNVFIVCFGRVIPVGHDELYTSYRIFPVSKRRENEKMIIRILIAGFASLGTGISYLVGLARMTTALLLGFGAFVAFVFGLLFLLPPEEGRLWFPNYGEAPPLPFFIICIFLLGAVIRLFYQKPGFEVVEDVSGEHFRFLLGGIGGYLLSFFTAVYFWFPSEARKLAADESGLAGGALAGTWIFFLGLSGSLYLLFRASRGCSAERPDLMRRFVLAVFAFLQFDKLPALAAYLLVYSPETPVIYPNMAALALAAYIPVALFLLRIVRGMRQEGR